MIDGCIVSGSYVWCQDLEHAQLKGRHELEKLLGVSRTGALAASAQARVSQMAEAPISGTQMINPKSPKSHIRIRNNRLYC